MEEAEQQSGLGNNLLVKGLLSSCLVDVPIHPLKVSSCLNHVHVI